MMTGSPTVIGWKHNSGCACAATTQRSSRPCLINLQALGKKAAKTNCELLNEDTPEPGSQTGTGSELLTGRLKKNKNEKRASYLRCPTKKL